MFLHLQIWTEYGSHLMTKSDTKHQSVSTAQTQGTNHKPNMTLENGSSNVKKLVVDPPSGWRYGFPRVWDKNKHPTLTHLLVSHNYPQTDLELANKYTRMWKE